MGELKRISLVTKIESKGWYESTPTSIPPSTGKIDVALLSYLMRRFGMGTADWPSQFVHGFPILGSLSQDYVFPISNKLEPRPLGPSSIFDSAPERFRERARRNPKEQIVLRKEAMGQVERGWLAPPVLLNKFGQIDAAPKSKINPVFRFPVFQSDKVRAIDDLRRGLVNRFCVIDSLNVPPSWDRIAEIILPINGIDRNWDFIKGDHESAYKNLPLSPPRSRFCVITFKNHIDSKWYGFEAKTHIFGAVASVLHYNVFSRLIASLANRVFGIPILGYVDDFGAPVPGGVSEIALRVFQDFCQILGVVLGKSKCSALHTITFLGLLGEFPDISNNMTLSISLTAGKSIKWRDRLRTIVKQKSISRADLESIIGKLGFSQTAVFHRFARTMMNPLYAKLYARPFHE